MAKIPFNVKWKPQIESGEYKVETFSGYPVTIYRWDFDDGERTPIMGSYVFEDNKEYVGAWNEEGHFDLMSPNDLDLFLITPEQELSEFEKGLADLVSFSIRAGLPNDGSYEEALTSESIRFAKMYSAKLLELARKEALKDLPRWKKHEEASNKLATFWNDFVTPWLDWRGHRIAVRDLEKLPGFNEK